MRVSARAYLAYTRGTRPTGRHMAKVLGIEGGIKPPGSSLDVLVRWGSRKNMPLSEIQINHPRAMALASDKVEAFRVFQNEGVPTPAWDTSFDRLVERCGRKTIIFGRNRSGMAGKDIVIYDPGQVYEGKYPQRPDRNHEFYSAYVGSDRELRLHVCDGKVIRVQGKYLDFPEKAEANPFVRNYKHGYRFRAPRQEQHRSRTQTAISAVKALGLDFGAVDMLVVGGMQYVLEVNTAPACSPLTARCYAAAIGLLVQQRSGDRIIIAPDVLKGELEVDDDERDW